jgi:hypothetical protein
MMKYTFDVDKYLNCISYKPVQVNVALKRLACPSEALAKVEAGELLTARIILRFLKADAPILPASF